MSRNLQLGRSLPTSGEAAEGSLRSFDLPTHHLVTHAVVTGMTGSGKTGLLMVLVEEALRSAVPVLMVDVKGDLPNLLLNFPTGMPSAFLPWIDASGPQNEGRAVQSIAEDLCADRDNGLSKAQITPVQVASFSENTFIRVLTPGSSAGESVHLLSSLERRSDAWDTDVEAARGALCTTISLVMRLIGRDPDPAASRDHVVLSVLAERRLREGQAADLASLLQDLEDPPIEEVGAMSFDKFLSKTERRSLAAALNALLASPTFAAWREGISFDIGSWLSTREDGKTPAVIVSVAHLDDEERSLVLGMLFEEILAYMRTLSGSSALRSLIVFDEVYGFLPPHPANPPTKRPLVALMKQARAFGVGVVLATQNPMDLDYRALSNAGLWFVGRLQTDADRTRVIDGMASVGDTESGESQEQLTEIVKRLRRRWFVLRSLYAGGETRLVQPRQTMSWLKGPLTRAELRRAQANSDEMAGNSA